MRHWLLGIGLIATTWLVCRGLYDLVKLGVGKLRAKRDFSIKKTRQEQILLTSSRVEKEVLARYITEDTTTIAFQLGDGIVNGLISKGILFRASQVSNPFSDDFDTNIQNWVLEYIKKHPEYLQDINPNTTGRHQFHFR